MVTPPAFLRPISCLRSGARRVVPECRRPDAEKLLLTKGGRITDSSLSKFIADQPKRISFEILSPDMQNWLREMGYPVEGVVANAVSVGSQ